MRGFFEGIETLFVDFLFLPMDFLRETELGSWFVANIVNWIFVIICASALVYWCLKLRSFDQNGTENQDTTAHSFLK